MHKNMTGDEPKKSNFCFLCSNGAPAKNKDEISFAFIYNIFSL